MGGPPPNCDDANPCTDDSCDPATGCVHENNTDACDDGDPCTVGDVCSGGVCTGGGPRNCDDANPCTDDSCSRSNGCEHFYNSGPCSDGNACTANDQCAGGACHAGPAADCDDRNPCTTDGCDPASGCFHLANSGQPCSDGNACTVNDACDAAGTACAGGPPADCNDGNTCTDDSCNPLSGCLHASNNTCGASPRGLGYWDRLCRGPHPSGDTYTQVDVDCVKESCVFASVRTVVDICARLNADPSHDKCAQAEAQFMAILLNVCRSRVMDAQPIDSQCTKHETVLQSRRDADSLLCNESRTFSECVVAQCESEEINSGLALFANSLRVQRLAGGSIKLTWSPPLSSPQFAAPGRYRLWRRPNSESPYVLLTETTNLAYTDTTAVQGNYQYEVTAVW